MSTGRTVGRNTLYTALGRFSVLLVWILLTPRILRVLGPEQFGLWSLLLVLSGSLATLDLGLGVALTRYLAELSSGEGRGEIPRLVLRASGLQIALAAVLIVPALLLRDPILRGLHVPLAWMGQARDALAWTLFAFAAGMVSNLMFGALQGLQRMEVAARVLIPAAIALAAAILWAMGSARPLVALVQVQFAYSVVVGVSLFLFVARAYPGRRAGAPPGLSLRRVLRFGGWLQATSLLALAQAQLDKFILGWFVALAPVGVYELAWRGAYAVALGPQFFLSAVLPAATQLGAAADEETRRAVYRRILEPYVLAVGMLTAGVFALAPAILEAWLRTPPPYSTFVLRTVILAQAANLFTGAASTMTRVIERAAVETRYLATALVLHAICSAAGLLAFGWRGVPVGYLVSSVLAAAWFSGRAERLLGLRPLAESVRAFLPALVAGLPAAALAMCVPLLFSGMPAGRVRGLLETGVGSVVFLAAFGGILGLAFRARTVELLRRTRALVQP